MHVELIIGKKIQIRYWRKIIKKLIMKKVENKTKFHFEINN